MNWDDGNFQPLCTKYLK